MSPWRAPTGPSSDAGARAGSGTSGEDFLRGGGGEGYTGLTAGHAGEVKLDAQSDSLSAWH